MSHDQNTATKENCHGSEAICQIDKVKERYGLVEKKVNLPKDTMTEACLKWL